MRATEGPDDYLRARWSDLVRTLVRLGAEVDDAESTARDATARCWSSWAEESRSGDVDLLVYGELLDLWGSRRRGTPADPGDVARVLTNGAGLDPFQVEALTGVDAPPVRPWAGEDWEDLYRGTPPLAAIHDVVRRTRRRRVRAIVGALVVTALLGVSLTVAVVLVDDEPPPPDRAEARNPIPLAWWGDDVLHLARRDVAAPGLVSLAQAGTDPTYTAVYTDDGGQVVQVEAGGDGTGTPIGVTEPGGGVLGSDGDLVAWIDLTFDEPTLVLWSVERRGATASLSLTGSRAGAGAELIGFEDGLAYLRASPGPVQTWRPGWPDTRPARPGSAFAGAVLRQRAVAPSGDVVALWGTLSAEVRITERTPDGRTRSAPTLDVPGSNVLLVSFVDDDTLVVVSTRTYLLGRDYDDGVTQSGRFPVADLVLCELATSTCEVAQRRAQDVDPSVTDSPLVLAR